MTKEMKNLDLNELEQVNGGLAVDRVIVPPRPVIIDGIMYRPHVAKQTKSSAVANQLTDSMTNIRHC